MACNYKTEDLKRIGMKRIEAQAHKSSKRRLTQHFLKEFLKKGMDVEVIQLMKQLERIDNE